MKIFINLLLVSILSISLFACGTSEDEEAVTQEEVAQDSDEGKDHEGHGHDEMEPFKFGVILVGPRDDKG